MKFLSALIKVSALCMIFYVLSCGSTKPSLDTTSHLNLPAVKDEKEPELDFNFKPIGLLNDESSNAYPFINYGTVASTDTLYDELWKLDIFPEMESLTHPARIEYNEQANVFTTSGHFKILDSAFNVVYELTDHMGTEVHHLDTEPIAVVSDQINISFIHLKTF